MDMQAKTNKKLWKDLHIARIENYIIFISFFLFAFYTIIKDYNTEEFSSDFFPSIIAIIICLIFIYILIRTRLTYITNKGISIGNAQDDNYEKLKLKKTVFIYWKNIKEIKIVRHEVGRMGWVALKQFLVIKTKEGKTYESFIANYKGFIKIMKKLNKAHLFSKDSKYQELINSKK